MKGSIFSSRAFLRDSALWRVGPPNWGPRNILKFFLHPYTAARSITTCIQAIPIYVFKVNRHARFLASHLTCIFCFAATYDTNEEVLKVMLFLCIFSRLCTCGVQSGYVGNSTRPPQQSTDCSAHMLTFFMPSCNIDWTAKCTNYPSRRRVCKVSKRDFPHLPEKQHKPIKIHSCFSRSHVTMSLDYQFPF